MIISKVDFNVDFNLRHTIFQPGKLIFQIFHLRGLFKVWYGINRDMWLYFDLQDPSIIT